jgi:hypothetical protein
MSIIRFRHNLIGFVLYYFFQLLHFFPSNISNNLKIIIDLQEEGYEMSDFRVGFFS